MSSALLDHAVRQLARQSAGLAVSCKICGSPTTLFDVVDFAKRCSLDPYPAGLSAIPVYYRRCEHCGFIFTDFFDDFTPSQWSTHVYNEDYAQVDPDYADVRPAGNARVVDALLSRHKADTIGLDYGGGSGRTCERLRAMGYAYDTCDPFGESSLTPAFAGRYNFCTAFEVAEHTPDPRGLLGAIVSLASPARLAILIGTQAHEGKVATANRLAWWYVAPRNGHISIYSRRSLELLAAEFDLDYISLSAQTHLLTRQWSRREALFFLGIGKLRGRLARLRP